MQKIFMVYETIGFYFIWKWYLNKRTHACKMYIHCKSQLQSAFAPKPKYIHFCEFKNKCYRSVANSLKHVSFRELFYNLITEASNYTYRLHIYLQSVLSKFKNRNRDRHTRQLRLRLTLIGLLSGPLPFHCTYKIQTVPDYRGFTVFIQQSGLHEVLLY